MSSGLEQTRVDVSVIVVSYNTRALTLKCLRSFFDETTGIDYEVRVVDNDSADGSADAIRAEFPNAALHASGENLGFGRATNLAADEARGEYLLLLNPDTEVLDGAVQKLLAFARSCPDKGIYGGRTILPDGTLDPGSCFGRITLWSAFCGFVGLTSLFRGRRLFDPESLGAWQRDSVRSVDIVAGCFMLIHRSVWEALGGFDPQFFMYGEEADFCLRARAAGYDPTFTPLATIIHHGGASEKVRADKRLRLINARIRLIRRHWSRATAPLGVALEVLRTGTRALAWRILSLSGRAAHREAAQAWMSVWKRRSELLVS